MINFEVTKIFEHGTPIFMISSRTYGGLKDLHL